MDFWFRGLSTPPCTGLPPCNVKNKAKINEMKAPSYITGHRELTMKVSLREGKMNTSHKDVATIADSEAMEVRMSDFLYQWLLILLDYMLALTLRTLPYTELWISFLQLTSASGIMTVEC